MDALNRPAAERALSELTDPCLGMPLAQMAPIDLQETDAGRPLVGICLPYPAAGLHQKLVQQVQDCLAEITAQPVRVEITSSIKAQPEAGGLTGVKNIIAVASGKGGVGKSTTAVNLALALHTEGAKVGLLDADIYGPSQGLMLGIAPDTKPQVKDEKWFEPIVAHGIQSMSMSYLVSKKTPLVWRGPMVSGAVQQLIGQTLWKNLDYLIVDMPPGTGDIHLTLTQKVPLAGALVVTTPQDIALLDARRAIEMFAKVKVPVLGVLENMSLYICPNCGEETALFGSEGGQKIAEEYGVALLGKLPLAPAIQAGTDAGRPPVAAEPEGAIATSYRSVARRLAALLALQAQGQTTPTIGVDDL